MRSNGWPESALSVVAACALEAAWISLVYVAIGWLAAEGRPPLSILAFGVATLIGLGVARWLAKSRRLPYGTVLAGLAIVAAFVGWLVPLGSAAVDVLDQPFLMLQRHPGGLLLGLAIIRGAAHVTPDDDERIGELALGPGLGGVAAIWILLTATGGSDEPWVAGTAFSATVIYVTAAMVSLGLARLVAVQEATAFGADRWTRIVLFGAVAILLAVSLPLAAILGVPFDEALRSGLGPIADLLALVIPLLLLPAALIATLLVLAFQFLAGRGHTTLPLVVPDAGTIGNDLGALVESGRGSLPMLGLVSIVVAAVAAALLIRAVLRRPDLLGVDRDVVEVREMERPGGLRLPRVRLRSPVRRRSPRTASEAYIASLDLLSDVPELARHEWETPAEHVRRLATDLTGAPMGWLAADYALAEFGRRTLSPAEHRRAIERWRRIRSIRGRWLRVHIRARTSHGPA